MPQRSTALNRNFHLPRCHDGNTDQKKKEHFLCKPWLKSSHSLKPLRDYKRDVMGKAAMI